MRLEECYRLLDLDPGATDEEVKTAWRDLTKVWHPDRFGHDRDVQQKAEERLKGINEAYEKIRAHRNGAPASAGAPPASAGAPSVRMRYHAVAIALAFAALFILMRRPTPGGLVIAVILFCASFVLIMRIR